MALKEQITNDMKESMKSGQKDRLAVIRLILAAIKQKEVDERITLDDSQVLSVLDKMLKQRRESVAQFQQGGRQDLVDKENAEIKVIQGYMPAQLSEAELDQLIAAAVAETGAATVKDMGKIMGVLKPKVAGKADMGAVSARIKSKLGG
ncbi:MAG: GatB/YqeY domain-containing protein [Bacillota bacterium]